MLIDTADNFSNLANDETAGLRLLIERNQTAAAYPRDTPIHRLFEQFAAETPDSIAVIFGKTVLTYAELNRRSNRLARRLRDLGVGPESPVGVFIERSPEMIIALLAILKAGGAYLPLDHAAPKSRLKFMLEDAGIEWILTQANKRDSLPEFAGKVLCLDGDGAGDAEYSDANLDGAISGQNLAYILFTSGSTGTPKGVMVAHRAVVRLVRNTDYVRLDSSEVLLQMAPLAFDASTFEIWGALLNGAKLVIIPPGETALSEIGRAVARHGVTTLWLTAGLFHQMADGYIEALRPLRQLLAGGDVLAMPQIRKAFAGLPDCRIINGYGPTEGTTFACCHTVTAESLRYRTLPVGRAIANTRAYIVDENLQPVSSGISGELCIGGDGVAQGYWNRPELTAEKFLPDPFSDEPNARLYRTGDRAQYLPDGNIEFLGRMDFQVKIRGYRIEIGEVESALLRHPAIRAAAILVTGDTAEKKQLTAYITAQNDAEGGGKFEPLHASGLRAFLDEYLPEYSIPAVFWLLTEFPLTANGKVDRNSLPTCGGVRLASGAEYAAPSGETEKMVAQVWREVLEVETIGLHENFFDCGGDSLRLTAAHGKLQEVFGLEIELTALFQYPTVSAFAAYLQMKTTPTAQKTEINAIAVRAAQQRDALQRRRQFVKG